MQGAPEIKGWCPGALTPMESGDGLLLRAKIVGSKLSLTQAERNRRDRARLRQRPDRSLAARAIANTRRHARQRSPRRKRASNPSDCSRWTRRRKAGSTSWRLRSRAPLPSTPMKSPRGSREPSPKIKRWNRCRANSCFSSTTARRPAFAMSAPIFDSRREARNSLSSWTARATKPSSRRRRRRSTPRSPWRAPSSNCAPGGRSNCVGCAPWSTRWARSRCCAPRGSRPNHTARPVAKARYPICSARARSAKISSPASPRHSGDFSRETSPTSPTPSRKKARTELRLTPWRAILAPTRSLEQAARIAAAARALGFIVDAGDARLAIAACPGAPECSQAKGPTRIGLDAIAGAAKTLSRGGIGAHVSGCAKGCAKPSATPLTLVANGGLFDLIHNGAASDAPAATGLTLAEIADVVARNGLMEASCPRG